MRPSSRPARSSSSPRDGRSMRSPARSPWWRRRRRATRAPPPTCASAASASARRTTPTPSPASSTASLRCREHAPAWSLAGRSEEVRDDVVVVSPEVMPPRLLEHDRLSGAQLRTQAVGLVLAVDAENAQATQLLDLRTDRQLGPTIRIGYPVGQMKLEIHAPAWPEENHQRDPRPQVGSESRREERQDVGPARVAEQQHALPAPCRPALTP